MYITIIYSQVRAIRLQVCNRKEINVRITINVDILFNFLLNIKMY